MLKFIDMNLKFFRKILPKLSKQKLIFSDVSKNIFQSDFRSTLKRFYDGVKVLLLCRLTLMQPGCGGTWPLENKIDK